MKYFYYICIALIAILLMILYDLYGAFLLAVIFLLLPCLSWGLGKVWQRKVSAQVFYPLSATRDTQAEIVLSAKSPWISFFSSLTAFLGKEEYDSYEEKATTLDFIFEKSLPHCGRLSLGKATLSWTDFFGLFHYKKDISTGTMVVLPNRIGQVPQILRSLLRAAHSDEVEYFGATEYKPGDNPHLINWKITASRDEVYVRDSAPADQAKIALAADYATDPEERDTIGDALYSAGLALIASHMAFHFVWVTDKGVPVHTFIRSESEWNTSISSFLKQGGEGALKNCHLSPSLPICYLTGNPSPVIAAPLRPTIWCAKENIPRAALSGRKQIIHALGGTPS